MRLPFVLFAAIAACTQFPELDGTIAPEIANAPPPDLIPLTSIVERANVSAGDTETILEDISPSLSNLRNRADRLRGPVIDPATRARMLRGVR